MQFQTMRNKENPVVLFFHAMGVTGDSSMPVTKYLQERYFCIMTPFLYLAIKSLYWSNGKTLGKILWCDDEAIKPYFIAAGKNLTYSNLRRQLSDSLEDKLFRPLPEELQRRIYFEFGSIEEHYKYRDAVMQAYPQGNYPVFEGYNHMQFQIRDPEGFATMLRSVMEENRLPELPFLKEQD